MKANTEDCKRPSSVDKNDENNSLVERSLAFWSKFDVTGAKPPTVPNVYARPHHYLEWTHEIKREINLKAINGVTKVNLKTFNSLKEAVLVAINSNKRLQVSNNMKCLSSDDLEKIKAFIAATQKRIQTRVPSP
ncbi:hypothetical protein [Parasitella parasitica]|uniref:Uncharacterized protein n=1 Tax=Parasitella parasitica TaxID=35722 RepID=A0A0B7NW33_9FUNG|nr:hypothetical protein [Parasitella parasitica]